MNTIQALQIAIGELEVTFENRNEMLRDVWGSYIDQIDKDTTDDDIDANLAPETAERDPSRYGAVKDYRDLLAAVDILRNIKECTVMSAEYYPK